MPAVTRVLRAGFWADPELTRWPLGKRLFYVGLVAHAEDSGVLEDDPFGWKISIFPSPSDVEITSETLAEWAQELIDADKATRFEASGKPYLFLERFHDHQAPPHPRKPTLPLPPWVTWSTSGAGQGQRISFTVTPKEQRSDCADSEEMQDRDQDGLGGVGLGQAGLGRVKSGGGVGEGTPDRVKSGTEECTDCWGAGCPSCDGKGFRDKGGPP